MQSFLVLFMVVAAVSAAPSSRLRCHVGDAEDHEIVDRFEACAATYDFGTGQTHLSGRHQERSAPFLDNVVPGHYTVRNQECEVKNHRKSMEIKCVCYSSLCNSPVAPLKLIEEKFSDL